MTTCLYAVLHATFNAVIATTLLFMACQVLATVLTLFDEDEEDDAKTKGDRRGDG
jgi:hypothetical protein